MHLPKRLLAKTLLRTNVVDAVLGSSLATMVRRRQFETERGQMWDTVDERNPTSLVIKELLETRSKLIQVQTAVAAGRLDRVSEICGKGLVVASARKKQQHWQAEKLNK